MSNTFTRLNRIFSSTQKTSNSIKPKMPQTHKPKPTEENRTPAITTTTEETPTHKTVNSKIRDLLAEKNSQNLVEKFTDMSKYSFFRQRCRHIYELTIHRLALSKQYSLIEQALESQKKYVSGEGFACRIIYLYGKYGMFDHAHKVFDELPERKVKRGAKCMNALLGAAANSGKPDMVYKLFTELPEKLSIEPNADCYNTAAHALCKLGLFDDAVSLLDKMEANGLKPSVVSYNTLLSAFYGKGDFEQGEKIWERMIKNGVAPDMCSYDFKLQGLVNDGKFAEAIELVMELKRKRLRPDVSAYNALIQGFCKDGDLNGAKRWYRELLKGGCSPNKITFATLVPFLCEKGDYRSAFEVCELMFKGRITSVDEAALQNVVDGLTKNSMVEEAKTLVELGRSNSYFPYKLEMPSMV